VKIKYNPRWALLTIMAFAAVPALPAQVSLGTVVDLAQRNSSAVRLAEADLQKAQAALAQTHDAYIPSLGFGSGLPAVPAVGFTGSPPSIVNATMQSLVYSLPQKQYVGAARSGVQAALLNRKSVREQVALDASTAYIELDTVNSELEAARQQETFAEQLVKVVQERAEAGFDSFLDLLQARLTAAQLKLKRLHLEARAAALSKQLAVLTGLPMGSILPDHASIPEIPAVKADQESSTTAAITSAQMLARAKQQTAHGDALNRLIPQISFNVEYDRDTKLLNNANSYFARPLKSDNLSSGFSIQVPIFNLALHAKAQQSAAEALRATVEAEEAQRQNDVQIASLTSSLRELDALAEVASLKQQIANEQLQSVLSQLELGNGSVSGPAAQPQLTPKAEQLARIDERQKFEDALDAGFDLAKARLSLLCALGHMEDWLQELHAK
jgi:outer membrane protein TolC